jgi:hypothetical protein
MHTASQSFFGFEQERIDAALAAANAKLQAKLARREQRKREELERKTRAAMRRVVAQQRKAEREMRTSEWRRRTDAARRERTPDMHAQCGIRWFACSPRDRKRGAYWQTCPECGQRLIYTSDPTAKPQVCAVRKK